MSAAAGQNIGQEFHVAETFLKDGARTEDILEEMAETGLFERRAKFRVFGDATGRNRDTRSKKSDYDIIETFLSRFRRKDNTRLNFEICVPKANPPVRTRHNKLNAKFCNYQNAPHLFVYKDADDANAGFQLTKLKKTAKYEEDDRLREQHVTTAIGYWVMEIIKKNARGNSRTIQL